MLATKWTQNNYSNKTDNRDQTYVTNNNSEKHMEVCVIIM